MLIRLRDLPWFTIFMVAAMITVALITNTHTSAIPGDVRARFGFGGKHLWTIAWHRAFLSVFLTAGEWRFWASLGMLAVWAGLLELRAGSRCAVTTFWFAHLATLLVMSLLVALPLDLFGHPLGRSLTMADDVGPSAGYYGCLGLLVTMLSRRGLRQIVASTIVTILVIQLVISFRGSTGHVTVMHSSLAHLVAFGLGFAVVAPFRRRRSRAEHLSSGRIPL